MSDLPGKPKLSVGDTLWFVPERFGKPREITVSSVGRKFAHCGTGWRAIRVSLDSWSVSDSLADHEYLGRAYANQEAYAAELAMDEDWSKLEKSMRGMYRRPEHINHNQIKVIAAILQIDLEAKPWLINYQKSQRAKFAAGG